MNDYEEMQQLYVEAVGGASYPIGGQAGQSIQTTSHGPNLKWSAGLTQAPATQSYRKGEIPTVSPGSTGGRQQRKGNITTIVAGDEEEGTLTRAEVKSAIVEELEDANPDCTFAFHELAKKLGIKIHSS